MYCSTNSCQAVVVPGIPRMRSWCHFSRERCYTRNWIAHGVSERLKNSRWDTGNEDVICEVQGIDAYVPFMGVVVLGYILFLVRKKHLPLAYFQQGNTIWRMSLRYCFTYYCWIVCRQQLASFDSCLKSTTPSNPSCILFIIQEEW